MFFCLQLFDFSLEVIRRTFSLSGVSFHFRKHLLFVSDSSGLVQCLTMTQRGTTKAVIYNSTAHPSFLSVDWLHDHLYILERSKVRNYFSLFPSINKSFHCFKKKMWDG